jgi:hypothetical protein
VALVALPSPLSGKTTKQQNNKTTKQQNNKTTKQQNNKTRSRVQLSQLPQSHVMCGSVIFSGANLGTLYDDR